MPIKQLINADRRGVIPEVHLKFLNVIYARDKYNILSAYCVGCCRDRK